MYYFGTSDKDCHMCEYACNARLVQYLCSLDIQKKVNLPDTEFSTKHS